MSKSYMVLVNKCFSKDVLDRLAPTLFWYEPLTKRQVVEVTLAVLPKYGITHTTSVSEDEYVLVYELSEFAEMLNEGFVFKDFWFFPTETRLTVTRRSMLPHSTRYAKSFLRSLAPVYLESLEETQKLYLWNHYADKELQVWTNTTMSEVVRNFGFSYRPECNTDGETVHRYVWVEDGALRSSEFFADTPWCNLTVAEWLVEGSDYLFLTWVDKYYGGK